jgi:hypothetical protein
MEGLGEEMQQVMEVQRIEGIRLALECLAWALNDRQNVQVFQVSSPLMAHTDGSQPRF